MTNTGLAEIGFLGLNLLIFFVVFQFCILINYKLNNFNSNRYIYNIYYIM